MAGRFPLYTDADVRGQLIKGLKKLGWDVLRAIEAFPERHQTWKTWRCKTTPSPAIPSFISSRRSAESAHIYNTRVIPRAGKGWAVSSGWTRL